jgi:hypothetical protein
MKIVFNTDNASFEDNPNEIEIILQRIIRLIREGQDSGLIRDSNGNTIGKWGMK